VTDITRQLPVVVPDREPLTEAEARRIGNAAHKLAKLRELLKEARTARSGGLGVGVSAGFYGSQTISNIELSSADLQAALALLIEREVAFLASFNVLIEETPT
jgi:hypothetical protein